MKKNDLWAHDPKRPRSTDGFGNDLSTRHGRAMSFAQKHPVWAILNGPERAALVEQLATAL